MKPATPLPWEELPSAASNLVHVEASDDHSQVCSLPKKRKQDAAYIVQSANAYPRLVKALHELIGCASSDVTHNASALLRALGELK